jgi:hypothetical protein
MQAINGPAQTRAFGPAAPNVSGVSVTRTRFSTYTIWQAMRIGRKVASAIYDDERHDACQFRHPVFTLPFCKLIVRFEKLVPENQTFRSPNNVPLSGCGIKLDKARKSNLHKHVAHAVARFNHFFVTVWSHTFMPRRGAGSNR